MNSFLNACLKPKNTNDLTFESSVLEDSTENQNRIDITLVLKDAMICIENKIFASLYNNLEEYKNHIDQKYEHKKIKFFVVLSLKDLDSDEKDKCKNTEFVNVRYQDFFEKIKNNLGSYIQDCDQRYLTYLLDFMKTIQNKGGFMDDIENFCESENYRFYWKHKKELDGIIRFAENMKNEIFARQQSQLSILQDFLNYAKEKTKDQIQCWTEAPPCIMHYLRESNLGVEFAFGISESNLCGKIRFIITEWRDWGKNAWEKHKGKIMEAYPGREFRQSPHKNQYFVDYDITITDGVIENRDELVEKIIEMDELLK